MALTTKQLVSIIIIIGVLAGGLVGDAYMSVQNHSAVPCLGCLGLSPVSGEFEEWWIDYPEGHVKEGQPVGHPSWILEALDEYEMIILFFWQDECPPCEKQWEDMKDAGLVSGSEANGKLIKYTEIAYLYSLDVADPKHNYRDIMYDIYDPEGYRQGTPTTVFLVTLHDNNIGWYSQKGYVDPDDVEAIMWVGLNIH